MNCGTVIQYGEMLGVRLGAISINNLHSFLCDFNLISGASQFMVIVG